MKTPLDFIVYMDREFFDTIPVYTVPASEAFAPVQLFAVGEYHLTLKSHDYSGWMIGITGSNQQCNMNWA